MNKIKYYNKDTLRWENIDTKLYENHLYVSRKTDSPFGKIKLLPNNQRTRGTSFSVALNDSDELIFWGHQETEKLEITKPSMNVTPFIKVPLDVLKEFGENDIYINNIDTEQDTIYLLCNTTLYAIGYNSNYKDTFESKTALGITAYKIAKNVKNYSRNSLGIERSQTNMLIVHTDGTLSGYGINSYGSLGLGHSNEVKVTTKIPTTFLESSDEIMSAIAVTGCSYLVTKKGYVYSCGYNSHGQLGLGHKNNTTSFQKVQMPDGKKVDKLEVTAGFYVNGNTKLFNEYKCVTLCEDNTVYTWGSGYYGIGFASSDDILTPRQLTKAEFKYDIDNDPIDNVYGCFYANSTFFKTQSGKLFAVGYNHFGQLGLKSQIIDSAPKYNEIQQVPLNENLEVIDVYSICGESGLYYQGTLLLVKDKNTNKFYFYSSGYNLNGQLGLGDCDNNKSKFEKIDLEMTAEYNDGLKMVSVNGFDSKTYIQVLFNNGRLYGWGNNEYGQLTGNCVTFDKITRPMPILGLVNSASDDSLVKEQTIENLRNKITELENQLSNVKGSLDSYYDYDEPNNSLNFKTNIKIKGTLQKDNSIIGDPDEDYITSKYFGEQFPIQFMSQMAMITGGSVNNLVLKNQSYTSPAYTFPNKTNIVELYETDSNNKEYNNFVITFTDTPEKLHLEPTKIGQSGIIKVIGAKKIKGYTSKLKSTIQLPVLDELNDTEYFSYYVFSFDEILLSRI